MWRWLKRLGRSVDVLRRFIVNAVFLVLLLLVVIAVLALRPQVPASAALLLDLQGDLVEQVDSAEPLFFAWEAAIREQTALADVLAAVRLAKDDAHIKMLVLDCTHLARVPLVPLKEVRQALLDFRAAGKKVVAIGDSFNQRQYFLASAADEVVLDPMGWVALTGFGLYGPYIKDLLQHLGIETHIFRAGRYKTAGEYLTRNDMSPEARQSEGVWLEQMWHAYKHDVATARGMDADLLQRLADQPGEVLAGFDGDAATMALKLGLVDRLASRHDIAQALAQEVGWDRQGEGFNRITMLPYLEARKALRHFPRKSQHYVAVVNISGPMLEVPGVPGTVDIEAISEQLLQVRKSERIKSLVLRIDSPGGSAFAAERLRREIMRVKEAGKPVVVSMGAVAASGGYWIAAHADEIWADALTLTGSIGVIGLLPKLGPGLERLGIHSDGIATGTAAGALRPDRPLHDEAGKALQLGVDNAYRRFLGLVAEGRSLSTAAVAEIAEGRVWSGTDAANHGLVDRLGGINQAIAAAARLAQLGEDYEAVTLRARGGILKLVMEAWSQAQITPRLGLGSWPLLLRSQVLTGRPLAISLTAQP